MPSTFMPNAYTNVQLAPMFTTFCIMEMNIGRRVFCIPMYHPWKANSEMVAGAVREADPTIQTVAVTSEKEDVAKINDIAEMVHMSRASFYRKIKGVLNMTPNDYLRLERLKTAARLLRDKRYHINEVCYMVGFSSTSYFAKCFQKQFGVLPKKYASE